MALTSQSSRGGGSRALAQEASSPATRPRAAPPNQLNQADLGLVGIHRTWASGLEPFMGPPVGRARSPPGLGPHECRGPGDTLPQKTRGPPPKDLGGLSARSSAIFHIRELHVLNTIGNIIGLAVAAGHRLLTRTREQEPMGRSRRTRTREPPRGAQPSPT